MIKNPVCKRCWCCREKQWAWPAWGHLFVFVRVRMPEASMLQKKKEVNITQACKLPATCQYKQNLPCFYSASPPHPQCLFPIWHPLFPSLQPQQLCFLQWESPFSSSHLCWTINPKPPEAEQKGWSSQESSSWNCGQMKHRIHYNANRGEQARTHWPISIYCLGAMAENR